MKQYSLLENLMHSATSMGLHVAFENFIRHKKSVAKNIHLKNIQAAK